MRWDRALHWAAALLLFAAAGLAVVNQTLYSKESIMEVLDYAMPLVGVELPPADQLFVARLLRRGAWLWHYWLALAGSLSALLLYAASRTRRVPPRDAAALVLLLAAMFATGEVLYLRENHDLPAGLIDAARLAHHYVAWALPFLLALHVARRLRAPAAASLTALLLLFQPQASDAYEVRRIGPPAELCGADPDCREGMAYLRGEKGAKWEEKILPSCPYERCREVGKGDGRHVDDPGGRKRIRILRRDYASAVRLLKRSALRGNPDAAAALYRFLSRQLDWRSPRPDRTLVKRMKERLGLGERDYFLLMDRLVGVLEESGRPVPPADAEAIRSAARRYR